MGTVAVFAFAIGGLATIGLMQLPKIFAGETQTQAAPVLVQPEQAEVTRAATPTMITVTEEVAPVEEPEITVVTVAAPAPSPVAEPVALTPEQVAAEKQAKIDEAIAAVNRNKMRMLTEGVVAGLYDVTVESESGQTRVALKSRNAATTANDLQNLIASAASTGLIDLPEAEIAGQGGIDAQTLLFDLVQTSLEQGTEKEAAAAQELRQKAFAASTARTIEDQGQQVYVVERGDSLAYIALQFYGNARAYNQIFEANRDKLTSADDIKVGQRLVIPNV